MEKIEIAGNSFELEDVSKRFLQKYLDRITDFVRKNNLDEDLYQDILQRLADKLNFVQTNNGNITEKDCINIINQIGEPEDIFSDIESTSSIKEISGNYNSNNSFNNNLSEDKKFYDEFIENGWIRDLNKSLILGVSNVLAEKSGLNVWIIRGLFLLFMFVGGISFWIYLLLGVSLPIKGVNYGNKTAYQYFTYQIFSLKLGIKNGVKNISGVLRVGINYLMKILTILFNNLWPIIRFFIFIGFGFLFLFNILFLIGLESIIYTNFTISNIEIGSIFPDYLNIGILLGGLALIILFVACIAYAFGKKLLNRYIFFATIILAFVSLFFFIATGFKLFQDYSQVNINKQTLSINLGTGVASGSFDILLFQDSFLRKFIGGGVYIYSSTGNKIDIVIENKVYAKKELSDKIFSGMALPKYENLNGVFKVYNEGNVLFKDKVPFSIFQRTVSLYIPQKFTFDIKQTRGLRVLNVYPPRNKLNYYNYGGYGCNGSKIYFSTGENAFVCENSNINKYGRRLYIQDYLSEKVDKIVPYKHSIGENSYYGGRHYYDGNSWSVHSFNWIDENTVVMKVYDDFLNLFLTLRVQETGENIEILDNKIKEIEQKRPLERNVYKDQSFTGYNLEYSDY